MKKKQLLVFIMAGSLAAGMSPVTMAFAEADTQTVTIEDTVAVSAESEEGEAAAEPVQDISDAAADTPVEEPAQAADTPTAEPTQAAADTPAAEPTQAAADTPAAEPAQAADAVVDDGFNSGDTAELTLEEEESATPTPETTGQIILKAADGTQTSYSTLAEAIAAAPVNIGKDGEVTQILVTGTVEISETVVIDQNKNISIAAAADGTTIKRAAGFLGDMFKVKDESTSFQFGTGKEGETVLSLTVTGALDQGDATGSIISVEGGYFGLSDGVTLTGNRTSAPGAAICNSGGSIGLAGGTITGNQSEGIVNEAAEITGGAIYSLGEIRVSGAVIVKDNKDDGLNDNSIVLGGDNACIAAIGQLAETADLQVRRSDAAAGKIIVKVGTDANGTALTTMENILAHVKDIPNDRAVLRAMHFYEENRRVADAVKAVENKNGEGFLRLLEESGNSSWEWLQNCYSLQNCKEQKITLSLALTKLFLNKIGAGICRVHGGGFAGVIMCVLPIENAEEYVEYMAQYVGRENVYPMNIRSTGAVHVE